ncbi:hypothetical protein CVT25_011234 [Psilocybe cyanescens]|uniref:Uncharacterized protein n=1 Tax=Psilocybe cyanescens TaxID=93625 RepID=A0A409WGJ6_PSICY|nr:hypothetical protein CVT25_011234 [Psilocybe cyanescens]
MSSQMFCRERRSWTAKEDQLLREAVQKEDPDNSNPSKWHAIAKHVPNRTNKDCRKRWFAKMASDVVKGGWAPDEDEKLVKGIERYGTRWSLVASVVQTRNSDQCAKRWTDTLNPAIDRTTWSSEADELLLRAVNEHGKVWTKIVKTYFPGRTGLSAKNRYNSITRFNSDISRSSRPRRKSSIDVTHYGLSQNKSESLSSSSSPSPETPSMSLPFPSPSFSSMDSKPYRFDSFPNWSSSSSATSDDVPSFRASPMTFDYLPENATSPSTPSTDGSYQSYDMSMNHPLSAFSDPSQLVFTGNASPIPPPSVYKNFQSHSHISEQPNYPSYSQYSLGHGSSHGDQFSFDGIPIDAGSSMNGNWDTSVHKTATSAYKLPISNEFSYVF